MQVAEKKYHLNLTKCEKHPVFQGPCKQTIATIYNKIKMKCMQMNMKSVIKLLPLLKSNKK